MPKYEMHINLRLIVSAKNKKAVRIHVRHLFKDAWWDNSSAGFVLDKFRADCTATKILSVKKQK